MGNNDRLMTRCGELQREGAGAGHEQESSRLLRFLRPNVPSPLPRRPVPYAASAAASPIRTAPKHCTICATRNEMNRTRFRFRGALGRGAGIILRAILLIVFALGGVLFLVVGLTCIILGVLESIGSSWETVWLFGVPLSLVGGFFLIVVSLFRCGVFAADESKSTVTSPSDHTPRT